MTTTLLPSPFQIKSQLPLSCQASEFIENARRTTREIVSGKDKRKALIIGPCSIHDRHSAIEFAKRFKELAEAVKESCFMVMRVYVEKPRTATGWKGLVYDPHLDGSDAIETGLMWTRELLITLAEMQVPCATEFVDPLASLYFEDLISWGFIGARTSSSQPHRQFASSLQIPVGFKNSTDGNVDSAIHGVLSAKLPHASIHADLNGQLCVVQSSGNPFSHIVLRGSDAWINYDCLSVLSAMDKLEKAHLQRRVMIDCSHGNCQKKFDKQGEVFISVLEQIERGNENIFGLMMESHLEGGSQLLTEDLGALKYAVSITDPCIDWAKTNDLILNAHSILSSMLAGASSVTVMS